MTTSMENQLLLTIILNTLLPAVSSATGIIYTSVVSLIKARNFQAKGNEFFIKQMFVLKELKR